MSIGSVGGGGNYFSDLNTKLAARGPDAAAVESARSAGGGKNDQVKSAKADKEVHHHHHVGEGLQLSQKAKTELDQEMAETGQAQEQLEMLGLAQDLEQNEDGQVSERTARNSERHTHLGEDSDHRVVANQQAETQSDQKEAERLQILDEDDGSKLNGDVPSANLEAASRVFSAQAGQGIKKHAELKPVPEVHEAGPIETKIVGLESSPMDIRDAGNDPRFAPMQLELPESTHEIAREVAARQLQSGELDEAMIR